MAAATLFLDLDGTVWDSRPWYAATVARLSGAPASEIEKSLAAGESIVRVASDRGVTKARLARAARRRRFAGVVRRRAANAAPSSETGNSDGHRLQSARMAGCASAPIKASEGEGCGTVVTMHETAKVAEISVC